jgi:hypothetical protein
MLSVLTTIILSGTGQMSHAAKWISGDAESPAPKNRFTYFRKVFDLSELPKNSTLRFAADSNGRLWINGHILRRKVARYHEQFITAEVIDAGPYLRVGKNAIVVQHHNWGDMVTFQRTGNKHAGVYVDSPFVKSDPSWRWITAPQFVQHDKQVVGVIGDRRIRYPQIVDLRKEICGDILSPDFDDSDWRQAFVVTKGPWPAVPEDVETPGQREYRVIPLSVLNAGRLTPTQPLSDAPLSMAPGIRTAKCQPDDRAAREAANLLKGQPTVIEGRSGESHYITFDFGRPVHGYPYLDLAEAPEATVIDLGYCELSRSLCSGKMHVDVSGWINPEGVVGPGYADRLITRQGPQSVEMPDERTARWLALHVHFRSNGRLVLKEAGIVKSQYPIKPVGSFSCGDERIDQIVRLCLIHAEVTMSDAYVDTPGREDGQWIEDDRPRALLAARWFDDIRLRRFLIRTHAQGQRQDGNLHPFSPSNYPKNGELAASYDWSVQWVACIYDDYMWTGRTDLVLRYWDNICRFWDCVLRHVDQDGLWRTNNVLADIRVGVGVPPNASSGIVTPWIIERLRWSAEMADAAGKGEKARTWREIAGKMTTAFRRFHVVSGNGNVPTHVADVYDPANPGLGNRGYSQAGQTIAVTAGLLTPEESLADMNYAMPAPDGTPPAGVTRWNNPTYGYRALRALSHVGLTERAVTHLIERYSPYLPANPRNEIPIKLQGPYGGPLPEYWVSREDLGLKEGQVDKAQPADETGSHGWGAVPLLWLHEALLGVTITQPGGGRIRIAPNAAGLPYVSGHTQTPKGVVWVHWDPQQWTLETSIPSGITAEIVMPAACKGKRIQVIRSDDKVVQRGEATFVAEGPCSPILRVR